MADEDFDTTETGETNWKPWAVGGAVVVGLLVTWALWPKKAGAATNPPKTPGTTTGTKDVVVVNPGTGGTDPTRTTDDVGGGGRTTYEKKPWATIPGFGDVYTPCGSDGKMSGWEGTALEAYITNLSDADLLGQIANTMANAQPPCIDLMSKAYTRQAQVITEQSGGGDSSGINFGDEG